ncbi:YihY/virulence factor BrkB family protein [Ilumatobacter sp.]|uniref:YihY/virulence factor BrkB family protein n=1 Tax=Ilumatobacter sp. TaxID=1967498 RepID=UPI003AF5CA68
MPLTDHPKVVELRGRSGVVDIAVETLDGMRRHQTGRNAAFLTYYGFLTLFPLFLAASTIVGFVLENEPDLRDDLVGSAVESVPFIGDEIASGTITGSWLALFIGLGAALWGSMKAFVGLQLAYDDTWEVPIDDRAKFVTKRLRALIGLAVIGLAQVGTVALGALVDQAGLPRFGQWMLILGGLLINIVVTGTMYRFLTSAEPTWRMVLAGALFCGILYTTLHFAGTALTRRMLQSAETYGNFAGVLALLSWISLHAIINLFGAEINAAMHRRRHRGQVEAIPAVAAEPPLAEA